MTEVPQPLSPLGQGHQLTHAAVLAKYAQTPGANPSLLNHMRGLAAGEADTPQPPPEANTELTLATTIDNREHEATDQTPEQPWPNPETTSPQHAAAEDKIIEFIPAHDNLTPPDKKLTAMVVEDGQKALTGAGISDPNSSQGRQLAQTGEAQTQVVEFPWEVPDASQVAKNRIREAFNEFQDAQNRAPQPEDVIRVPGTILEGSPEWIKLTAAGLSEYRIRAGRFTRGELMAPPAGFFFVNKLGGGEKAILHAAIPDPRQPGQSIDFSQRSLLTREEVEIAYTFQQNEGYGLNGQNPQQVQADALLFLDSAFSERPFENEEDLKTNCLPDGSSTTWVVGTEADHELVDELFSRRAMGFFPNDGDSTATRNFVRDDNDLSGAALSGIGRKEQLFNRRLPLGMVVYGRNGRELHTIASRNTGLAGSTSPFLDSGFIFSEGPDVSVAIGEQSYRFNTANIHLMNAHPDFPGFSEMGQADWDQQYLTAAEYAEYILPDQDQRVRTWAQDLRHLEPDERQQVIQKAQENLIEYAKIRQTEVIEPLGYDLSPPPDSNSINPHLADPFLADRLGNTPQPPTPLPPDYYPPTTDTAEWDLSKFS